MKKLLQIFRVRKFALALADSGLILLSGLIANTILSYQWIRIAYRYQLATTILTILTCIGSLSLCGAYHKMWRYFNSRDYLSCVYGVIIGCSASSLIIKLMNGDVSVRYMLLQGCMSVIGIVLFRYIFKQTFVDLTEVGRRDADCKRTMIIGGGQACEAVMREIRNAKNSPHQEEAAARFDPVCIIDDDPAKLGRQIEGIQILGATDTIAKFAGELQIEQILFCIPSCQENDRKRILNICSQTNLPVKVIPFLGNMLLDDGRSSLLAQARSINVEDLLGRDPITFDNKDIREFIRHKVCMVTGGGGSIGSELVRQIAKYNPRQIVIVDISENYAYDIQQELIETYGNTLNLEVRIASVRDYYRMNGLFAQFRPDIVFHAAAHKHVPLMEDSPMEAIKNNVIGTFNTASLAQFYEVEKFVMISTDKAVNPTNVMGASKRCCEMIVQYLAQQPDCRTDFVTTRFGNVLGSNGSVIPKFKRQIESGKPVTVTHPDIIRYFMTIPEAVSLVMEAAAIAQGGEIFVLDMGQPVRIVTLAENLIRMYGKVPYKDVKIEFTGLRPGEKIKEELLMNEEGLQKTKNKLIFIGRQIDIDQEQFIGDLRRLRDAAAENDEAVAIQALHDMVPTFVTPEEFNSRCMKS